jgi:hypothetical protein
MHAFVDFILERFGARAELIRFSTARGLVTRVLSYDQCLCLGYVLLVSTSGGEHLLTWPPADY